MPRAQTLLATGATGLVMSHVVRAWLERHPDATAVGLDLASPDPVVQVFFAPVAERLSLRAGDLRDESLLRDIAQGHAVTHVVHGAAVTSINRLTRPASGSPGMPGDMTPALPALEVNVLGTARVLAWAGRLPRLAGFVTVSSGSVYAAEGPSPLPEDGHVAPEGLYAISKYAGELFTAEAARQFGVPALSVRLSGVYGPLDRDTGVRSVQSVPGTLLRAALAGQELSLSGLEATGDYVHAGDVGRAVAALLDHGGPRHPVYNIAFGEAVSLRELAELTSQTVPGFRWRQTEPQDADLALESHPTGGRWGAYDISRLAEDCGWRPRGLAESFADYRDWLNTQPY